MIYTNSIILIKMKIIILSTQSGDWEGVYIENNLITEGHIIDRYELLDLSVKYLFSRKDISHKTINDEDEEIVSNRGSFFSKLSDFNGEY